jgi:dihydrofolate reductase
MTRDEPAAPVLTIIAAVDQNLAIGRDNRMPWHLPDDFRRFKALSLGKPVIMGRLTAESIGRALPGRRNLVITRGGSAPYPDQEVVGSLDEAIKLAGDVPEVIIAGGGQVYAEALPRADRVFLTWVETALVDPDTHFPSFPDASWVETSRDQHPADDRHPYAFSWVDYARA